MERAFNRYIRMLLKLRIMPLLLYVKTRPVIYVSVCWSHFVVSAASCYMFFFFFFALFIAVSFNNIYLIHVLGIYIFLVLLWNSIWLFVTFAFLLWFPVLIQLNLFIIVSIILSAIVVTSSSITRWNNLLNGVQYI